MPFDIAGNYTRLYDWTADRDADIKIQAARMDAEADDYAAAFNMMFFRNGLVAMTGDLDLGGNRMVGLAQGGAANPSLAAQADTDTGVFWEVDNVAFAFAGRKRFAARDNDVTVYETSVGSPAVIAGRIRFASESAERGTLSVTNGGVIGYTKAGGAFSQLMAAANFPSGTAAPNNANGADGDFYFQYA